MIKNSLFILIFLISSKQLIAQETRLTQEQWYEKGQENLKKNNLEDAISKFYMANNFGENPDIKALALHKIDSLLPIMRMKLVKKCKGNWKLKELNYNPYPGKFPDYIRFEDDKIIFFKKNKDGKIIILRSEPIIFLSYDSMRYDFNLRKVVFKNSEIWSFWVGKKNSQKRLYPTLERDSSRTSKMLLDERGIIKKNKLRKKELKKEIYTFYVKSK